MKATAWVLGDQLTLAHPAVRMAPSCRPVVLMVESLSRASRHPWHRQKLVLVWSAMRHYATELASLGYVVDYYEQQHSLRAALQTHLARYQPDQILIMRTAEYQRAAPLARLARSLGVSVRLVDNTMFVSSRDGFATWAQGKKRLTMEPFYRRLRRQTGFLMEDRRPSGERWNFDKLNRQRPPEGHAFPSVPAYAPDGVTAKVIRTVEHDFPDAFGEVGAFAWPVTRRDAEEFLEDFLEQRLDCFGPYEDAMVMGERSLCHSLISPFLNLGLLDPLDVCRRAVARYEAGKARLSSVEGFVRQIIGWREFVYHIYHLRMPAYRQGNYFYADLPLPSLYWDARTQMRCVAEAVSAVRHYGHNHHIQRLMVTGNFALLAGIRPQEVNEWYLAAYVDAYDWVVTPNVLGMALFADGGVMATKPYAASANYISRMGDYCGYCDYNRRETIGDAGCPFNALYWDFLARNETRIRAATPRMNLMLAALHRKPASDMGAIRDRAARLRDLLRDRGTL